MTQWNQETDSKRLKVARLALRKSQVTAATILGVTHPAYSRWELGHSTPAKDRQERLFKFIALGEKIARGER